MTIRNSIIKELTENFTKYETCELSHPTILMSVVSCANGILDQFKLQNSDIIRSFSVDVFPHTISGLQVEVLLYVNSFTLPDYFTLFIPQKVSGYQDLVDAYERARSVV